MNVPRLALAVMLPALALVAPAIAHADPAPYTEQKTDGGSLVIFVDNPLDATPIGPLGAIVGVGPKASRLSLMRPRYQFVREMLRTIETL